MKNIIILSAILLACAFTLSAVPAIPDDLGNEYGQVEFSATDPEYEWSQIDSKHVKVGLKSQSLLLESKQSEGFAYSVTELPIDVEETPEFLFGFTLKGFKPGDYTKMEKLASKLVKSSDNKGSSLMIGSFGLLFDYQDIHNYRAIAIFQKSYQYFVVKDGVLSMIKSGPVKYRGDLFKLIMKREGGGIELQLNGIEVCKLRKINLTSSYFGVFINGKGKAEMPSFMIYIPEQEETEHSTSNT